MTAATINTPLVSIAVNNYNYAAYLREAIDSALAQTYPNVEVIVVDDGSTDDSRKIIADYGERIRSVLKENGGQASAFNAGFTASSGEIVIFLDADDVLKPEAARRVVEAWRPGLAKIQYLLEVIDGKGKRKGGVKPTDSGMPSGDLRRLILSQGAYTSSPTSGNAFARRTLEELLPIPEEWRISADGYLIVLAPFLGDVVSLQEKLGYYRMHGSNDYAMRELDPQKIRKRLAHDLRKQELLHGYAELLGVEVPEDLALRIPSHVGGRIASLRLEPDRHPYPEDRLLSLIFKGIASCRRNQEFAPKKKLLYSAWFVLAGLSPAPIRQQVMAPGLIAAKKHWSMGLLSPAPQHGASRREAPVPKAEATDATGETKVEG